MSVYLDYNASTPINKEVLNEMIEVYQNNYGNSESRTHDYGYSAHKKVEEAREKIAELLKVSSNEIIFTSGATESDNIAILGLREYAEKTKKKHIITTAIEHKAVLEPCKQLEKQGFEVDYVFPNRSGRIDVDEILSKVRRDTLLVSVMHVNNETGIIQPVDILGKELGEKETFFHIDAAQSCGKLVEELRNIKYDMLSVTAHKMYGPQGIGALILKRNGNRSLPVSPIVFGGGHERGIRSGTIPTALVCGFGKTCEIISKNYNQYEERYSKTKKDLLNILNDSGVVYEVNGEQNYCISNTMNISIEAVDAEALMLQTKQWCSISNGSACNASSYDYSYVLKAMGLSEECRRCALRISWGTEKIDLKAFENLLQIAKKMTVKR